jgi:hypothetical protein
MKKLERIAKTLDDDFRDHLAVAMRDKFGIEVETHYAFLADRLVTTRVGSEDFTPEQHAWLGAWAEGYSTALGIVRAAY